MSIKTRRVSLTRHDSTSFFIIRSKPPFLASVFCFRSQLFNHCFLLTFSTSVLWFRYHHSYFDSDLTLLTLIQFSHSDICFRSRPPLLPNLAAFLGLHPMLQFVPCVLDLYFWSRSFHSALDLFLASVFTAVLSFCFTAVFTFRSWPLFIISYFIVSGLRDRSHIT